MQLIDMLAGLPHTVLGGDPGTDICEGITTDSRQVRPGQLFIALSGRRVDGHRFLGQAVAKGATAVLVEGAEAALPPGVCVVRVPDTWEAAAAVAARYFGDPGRELDVVAITGTNGKTSVAFTTEALLRRATGTSIGVIGTGGHRIGDEPVGIATTTPTTPQAVDLQHLLREMRGRGAGTVVMEASSMALAQHRVAHTHIDVGVFTNLTPDHLDDHGTMARYKDAKLRLFRGMARRAVVNTDDPVGREIAAMMAGAVTTYGLDDPGADLRATDVAVNAAGTTFTLHHAGRAHRVTLPVPGRFVVANALAAVATGVALGYDSATLARALDGLPTAPGRFQTLRLRDGATTVVDYAHSPDALENVLSTIRGFTSGRVITVFGCGGDRDPSKRAPMGEIAGRHSDLCVLTSDNPRSEDPERILDQIAPGVAATGTPFERITDRRDAIAHALAAAGPGDVVLIAGKGSEGYQIIGDRSIPFDDLATVRDLQEPADSDQNLPGPAAD
ncbi:UDP-N-acetylmuramoyl-L-alanyl-D-glutamate--2,6-diaminopimelate ligase [Kitasatospora sp. RB6PN24]|uniref:UDP-N-acetylmuramoyl-L-alanyl-D-glutamate--2, 6-diaminopimelate ligase n=1 Tax=Kitasatospora humi TaxID=2893891 RepID=UPI001E3F931E|nr:UDP-N-acetylmuramoyl-L-alanyl-D-glutamate--2,6-diaminopimelate ligase [Kitasatospora humi]MCC9307937.1 UDP-N-acetylmuramoyl-L-alanyl-D-glutamate--2,6-diaminopimelate ligase [Kitasatospora humi]